MGCGDPNVWNPEIVADRIKRGLDVIGNVVGGILYRGLEYWEVLPPGTEGQQLFVGPDQIPVWADAPVPPFETSFSDDFNRSNTTYGFGDEWEYLSHMGAAGTSPAVYGINSNQLLISSSTVAAFDAMKVFWPVSIQVGLRDGVDQFAEAEFRVNSSVALSRILGSGVVAFAATDRAAFRCYLFASTKGRANTNFETWGLYRLVNGTRSVLAESATGANQFAAGDVFRLEVSLGSGLTNVRALINGSEVANVDDSSGDRCLIGVPGVAMYRINANVTTAVENRWDNFSCGEL